MNTIKLVRDEDVDVWDKPLSFVYSPLVDERFESGSRRED
jgi:hypothetical protein